jgi:Tfp pilus assembly protein PilO
MNETSSRLRVFDILLHAALLAPVLVGALLAHLCIFSPMHQRAEAARARLEQVEGLLQTAPAVRRQHAQLQQTLKELETRAEAVARRIPDSPEEAEFLQQIHQAAEESRVVIDDYRRGALVAGTRHSQLEVRLVGSGDYAGICRFFHRLGQLQRQTQPQNVLIRANPDGGRHHMELSMLLFFRSPEGEARE